jgi:hypothetical protein
MNGADIYKQIEKDTGRIKGKLNNSTKQELIKVVNNSKLISLAHKKLILGSL